MHCSLIWLFCSEASQKKSYFQYRSPKLLSNDYGIDYQLLLEKTKKFCNGDKELIKSKPKLYERNLLYFSS